MFGISPITPAYGRVYSSKTAIEKAWKEGKDFKCPNGQMCSIRDFKERSIEARYGKKLEK